MATPRKEEAQGLMQLAPAAHAGVPRGWVVGLIGGGRQRGLRSLHQQPSNQGGHASKAWKKRGQLCQTQGRGWAIPERRGRGKGREGKGKGGGGRGEAKMRQDTREHLNAVLQSAVKRRCIQ